MSLTYLFNYISQDFYLVPLAHACTRRNYICIKGSCVRVNAYVFQAIHDDFDSSFCIFKSDFIAQADSALASDRRTRASSCLAVTGTGESLPSPVFRRSV